MKYLTIAVPSYNAGETIARCLNSFSDARLNGRLEVLIVNDGSTDDTRQVAKRFVEAYPQIFHLIDQQNAGHGGAINTGIVCATGKYFRVVDADDWVDTEALIALIGILERTDSDLVVDQRTLVDMSTRNERFEPLPDQTEFGRELTFRQAYAPGITPYLSLHTLSVRLTLLRAHELRLLQRTYYEDFEYVLKATAAAANIAFFDLAVYYYQVGNAAQSVDPQNYVLRYEDHCRVVHEALRYAREGRYDREKAGYVHRSVSLLIHTHLNICLIYNGDRKRGRRQAAEFMRGLKRDYPEAWRDVYVRYFLAWVLHSLRVDHDRLQILMRRRKAAVPGSLAKSV